MPSSEFERENDETDAEPLLEKAEEAYPVLSRRRRYLAAAVTTCMILLFTASFLWVLRGKLFRSSSNDDSCQHPAIRQEWRTLRSSERLEYIRAVKCLSSIPSSLCNGSLHDEFAYVHRNVGEYSHEAAPFLPWHRYFIHIYEHTLKTQCGYQGTLPYWDWTRDSANLAQAPVWDATEGFGGNGNVNSHTTLGGGYCVEDGPFAGLEVQYYNQDWNPHCLSRGFLTGAFLDHFGAQRLNSSAVATVLDAPDYYDFLLRLEDGPHSSVPTIVRGDFLRFTAPNDPIFFLHHAQIDRLWWHWQQRDPAVRVLSYNGPTRTNSSIAAQLADPIEMDGLAPDISVRSVMSVDRSILCYKYQG